MAATTSLSCIRIWNRVMAHPDNTEPNRGLPPRRTKSRTPGASPPLVSSRRSARPALDSHSPKVRVGGAPQTNVFPENIFCRPRTRVSGPAVEVVQQLGQPGDGRIRLGRLVGGDVGVDDEHGAHAHALGAVDVVVGP